MNEHFVLIYYSTASILYLPSNVGFSCPFTMYPFATQHSDWKPLNHGSLQGLPDHKIRSIEFSASQVRDISLPLVNRLK